MEQLVQAAIIADRLQISAGALQAADLLIAAIEKHAGCPQATVKLLSGLGTLPGCLLPVLLALVTAWEQDSTAQRNPRQTAAVERLLVAAFGRLNDVWADKQLQELLLQLPLPGIELLLHSDKLQVDSEDTVLYTAVQYVKGQSDDTDAAVEALAATIRCPQCHASACQQ